MSKDQTRANKKKKHLSLYYINNTFYVPRIYKVHWAFDHLGDTYGTASASDIDSFAELIESCPDPLRVDIEAIKSIRELNNSTSSFINKCLEIDPKCTPFHMAGYKSDMKFGRDAASLFLNISITHTKILYKTQKYPEGHNMSVLVINTADSNIIAKWICTNLDRFGPQPKKKKKYGEKTELIDVSNLK